MIRKILFGTLLLASVATALVTIALLYASATRGGDLTLPQLTFFLEAYKAIGVGFLVALLGVILPHAVAEARDSLERFKDSRVQYSQAKTSVIYLPQQLTGLDKFADAVSAIRRAHEKLHLCETYEPELRKHLRWHPNPGTWVDRNYWELTAMARTLTLYADRWPGLSPRRRLEALQRALTIVDAVFGPDNGEWLKNKAFLEKKIERDIANMRVDPSDAIELVANERHVPGNAGTAAEEHQPTQ